MGFSYTSIARCWAIVAFAAACMPVQPALSQSGDNDIKDVRGSYATKYARYYAPYALQASAAYVELDRFNKLLGPNGQPNVDGADVQLATESFAGDKRAANYLRSWQFQFGSTGYLTCYEANPDCLRMIEKDKVKKAISGGPTFQVWARTGATKRSRAACREVSIAFRGSTSSFADWISNLDYASGYFYDDEYRQLRRNIDGIIGKITQLDCVRRAKGATQIVSVGHSLGGGLAQLAGLANNPKRPKIVKVFAFDPSPVTGASYVEKSVYDANVDKLEIDRVYQIGEILQPLRAVVQGKPAASSPCVRSVRYDLTRTNSPIGRHNWDRVAGDLVGLSYDTGEQQKFVAPPALASCGSKYRRPTTDEDAPDAQSPDGVPDVAAGPNAARIRTAGRSPDRALVAYAPLDAGWVSSTRVVRIRKTKSGKFAARDAGPRDSGPRLAADVAAGSGISGF